MQPVVEPDLAKLCFIPGDERPLHPAVRRSSARAHRRPRPEDRLAPRTRSMSPSRWNGSGPPISIAPSSGAAPATAASNRTTSSAATGWTSTGGTCTAAPCVASRRSSRETRSNGVGAHDRIRKRRLLDRAAPAHTAPESSRSPADVRPPPTTTRHGESRRLRPRIRAGCAWPPRSTAPRSRPRTRASRHIDHDGGASKDARLRRCQPPPRGRSRRAS